MPFLYQLGQVADRKCVRFSRSEFSSVSGNVSSLGRVLSRFAAWSGGKVYRNECDEDSIFSSESDGSISAEASGVCKSRHYPSVVVGVHHYHRAPISPHIWGDG